ncbi:MAG: hypothetical protein QG551_12 [Patescibacteria group bacterium]|jgi:hypothetical protein|nr:hypothetical protein [Patescibacteria group bacterium]
MARNFDRNAVKRLNKQTALEQLISEQERQQAINDVLEEEERIDREWKQFCDDVSEQQRIEDTLGENAFAMIYGDRRLGHEAYHQRQTAHTEP